MAWFAGRRGRGNGGRSHWPPALTQCALDVAGSGPTTWRGSRTAIGSPTVAPPAIASEVLEHRAPALSDCSHSASLTTTTKKTIANEHLNSIFGSWCLQYFQLFIPSECHFVDAAQSVVVQLPAALPRKKNQWNVVKRASQLRNETVNQKWKTCRLRSEVRPRRVRLPMAVSWLWLKSLETAQKSSPISRLNVAPG